METETTVKALSVLGPTGVGDAVDVAMRDGMPLVDYGVAHAGLGHPPPDEHVKLTRTSDADNEGVLEHYVRDLTVRAAAGVTMGALQAALRPTNQFLPIDADDDLTLGEVIDHNVYGPLRVGYGSVRDLLLGLRYIDGQGRDIHVGGRTVKNVAGYDVTRFMVGGLGQFGIVHEATLRTYAIPEHVLTVDLELDDPTDPCGRVTDLMLSDAAPVQMSLCRRPGTVGGGCIGQWIGRVAYFGRTTATAVQLRSLETLLDGFEGVHIRGSGQMTLEQDRAERAAQRAWRRNSGAVVKIIVPPAATGAACMALCNWAGGRHALHIDALPVHGCIFTGGELDAQLARRLDDGINNLIAAHAGMRTWHQRPPGAEDIAPFAPPQSDWPLLAKLKKTMDPQSIFNPGRLF